MWGIVWGYDLPSLLLGPLSLYYRLTAPSYFCDRFVLYQACQLDALPMTSVWCSPHSPQIYHQSQVILSMLGRWALGARSIGAPTAHRHPLSMPGPDTRT